MYSSNKGYKTLLEDLNLDFWEVTQNKEFYKGQSQIFK